MGDSAHGPLGHGPVSSAAGRLAITFDDGPDPVSTIPVLDRLDEFGVVATFFCLGSMAAKYPDTIHEISARGHDIGIHGYEHSPHLLRSPRWVWRDVLRSKAAMEALGIARVRWFRPPYGVISSTTLAAAKYARMDIVLWSAWGKEWTTVDSKQVSQRVVTRLDDGVIILLHDADTASPPDTWKVAYDALPHILEAASDRNLQPVALSTMLGARPR
ncbi:MAG: polysaccharide deacetylase family protein [Acidimicrobiales bacterium]